MRTLPLVHGDPCAPFAVVVELHNETRLIVCPRDSEEEWPRDEEEIAAAPDAITIYTWYSLGGPMSRHIDTAGPLCFGNKQTWLLDA